MPGFFGGGGLIYQPDQVNLLDSKMDLVNGHLYTSRKNEFGTPSGQSLQAMLPVNNNRWTNGWSTSPLNTVVHHGTSPFDNFGTDGVPARPDSGDGFATGFWCANPNRNFPAMQLEHGLDIETIKYWYFKGVKTWQLRLYFAALPWNAAIMAQNLTSPTTIGQTEINWEPGDATGKNKFYFRINYRDSNTQVVADTDLLAWTVQSAWQLVTYNLTFNSTHEKYFRRDGYDTWQLLLRFGCEGHIRQLIYNPSFKPVL